MTRIVSCFILFFYFAYLKGQDVFGFENALIIKKNSDTLTYCVKKQVYYLETVTCLDFGSNQEFFIHISEISSIKFSDKILVPVPFRNSEKLMIQIEKGRISLYAYVVISEKTDLPYSGGRYTQYNDSVNYYVIRKDDLYYEVKKKDFNEKFPDYISECDELMKMVSDRIYKFNDLVTIVREYNICIN